MDEVQTPSIGPPARPGMSAGMVGVLLFPWPAAALSVTRMPKTVSGDAVGYPSALLGTDLGGLQTSLPLSPPG